MYVCRSFLFSYYDFQIYVLPEATCLFLCSFTLLSGVFFFLIGGVFRSSLLVHVCVCEILRISPSIIVVSDACFLHFGDTKMFWFVDNLGWLDIE